jgi:hypothetical protein
MTVILFLLIAVGLVLAGGFGGFAGAVLVLVAAFALGRRVRDAELGR